MEDVRALTLQAVNEGRMLTDESLDQFYFRIGYPLMIGLFVACVLLLANLLVISKKTFG